MLYDGDRDLVPAGSVGSILFHGVVYDGDGVPVPDAMIEIWQADAAGTVSQSTGSLRRDGWTFSGFGRASTGRDGRYTFSTVTPGVTEEGRPPFFAVTVFARGLLDRLFTRAYLPGNDMTGDALWNSVPADRRPTLLAEADGQGFRFDVHLQGDDETVFLRYPGM
ncbi:protocatechuate 3,4-dioxygenase [Gordonia phthalatica]|uniref:Protocatechuate 3,4-dioxygenase n=2 Tax=Gordonia phthalatica TaxID=1136941 RepID=A0A0N9NH90_9ACTN|nr:protocatechuate 3,4-dioxygenase [Gordonia phthalatica]